MDGALTSENASLSSTGSFRSLDKLVRIRKHSFVSWVGENTSKTHIHCLFNLHLKMVLAG